MKSYVFPLVLSIVAGLADGETDESEDAERVGEGSSILKIHIKFTSPMVSPMRDPA